MFENLRKVNKTKITDMRGLIDPTNLSQFNQFEGGYSVFAVVSIPKVLVGLSKDERYTDLITAYTRILEQEFRGLNGLDNITADTQEWTNGLVTMNMITKVNEQSSGTFSMTYTEKAGAILTRTHELLLKAIKDTRTGFKHYHGLVYDNAIPLDQVGFESECFSFLYIVTDNTGLRIERATYIVGAQPTDADISSLFNGDKGQYDFKEITCEFIGFALTGDLVDKRAKEYLAYLTGYRVDRANGIDVVVPTGKDPVYTLNSTDYKGYVGLAESDEDTQGGSVDTNQLGGIGNNRTIENKLAEEQWR